MMSGSWISLAKKIFSIVVLFPIITYASGEIPEYPCEAETAALMTMNSSWEQLFSSGSALPEQCFDGYFAEGISDTLVRNMGTDWQGFIEILDQKANKSRFITLILQSINESLDPKDVDLVVLLSKDRCPQRYKEVCDSIIKRADTLQW